MALTDRERFKYGFLLSCVERGLQPDEVHQLVKSALAKQADPVSAAAKGIGSMAGSAIKGTASGVGSVLKFLGRLALPAAVAAPVAAGAGTGYLLGSSSRVSDEDVAEEKQRELIDAYQSAAARARSNNRLARARHTSPQSVRSLI